MSISFIFPHKWISGREVRKMQSDHSFDFLRLHVASTPLNQSNGSGAFLTIQPTFRTYLWCPDEGHASYAGGLAPPILAEGSAGIDPLADGLVPPPAVQENLKRVIKHFHLSRKHFLWAKHQICQIRNWETDGGIKRLFVASTKALLSTYWI